ncbi:MAG TPA: CAP domain-containing protein [Terriglobales bacterium]
MFWALIIVLASSLGAFAAKPEAADTAPHSSPQQVSPYDTPSYETSAEKQLLEMANAERTRAGLAPLKMDSGLVQAARAHAMAMASKNQISHQFSGEPPLTQRISANSALHLDREGENVAVATTADDAQRALMASPPHRDNLLSPNFNVAGIGVYRKDNRIYVAQDFGDSLPSYSVKQAQELVADSVEQLREQAKMPRLQRASNGGAEASACAMAQADSLSAAAPPAGAYMLRYTSMQPETIPSEISKVISQRGLLTYSAGTCYARTPKYPNGAYWVVLMFY